MRFKDVFVAGVAYWLPGLQPTSDAVAAGQYTSEDAERDGYLSVAVADEAPPEMAVRAARLALRRAAARTGDVAVVLHTSLWYQGVDFWPAASYVHQGVLGGGRYAPALDVGQMSNGSLGAVELAARYIAAGDRPAAALVSSADRFAEPAFDRWRSDVPGIVYGDGAAAIVLARQHGFARLVALGTVVDTRLEKLYRGDIPFGPVSGHAGPVDIRRRRQAYLREVGHDTVVRRTTAGLTDAVGRALADAGLGLGDVARVVFPNVGLASLRSRYLAPLGLDIAATTWEWGRTTAHVGGADQLTGLAHLVQTGQLEPGDRVLLVGIGAGFSWSAAVLEMLRQPAWAAHPRSR